VQDPHCVQLVNGTTLVRLNLPGWQRGISQGGVVVLGSFTTVTLAASASAAAATFASEAAAARSLQ
jgi:hypothetical protein